LNRWINIGEDFFWAGKKNKKAIIWLNGQKCIGPKEKEVWDKALRK
jgi:hypothetical protein